MKWTYTLYRVSFDLQNTKVFGMTSEHLTEDNIADKERKTETMDVDESRE